jgi:hypothetical protein
MSSSQTAVIQLFKATPGTAETWRTSDVNANWDKIDSAIGQKFVDVTAGTANNTTTETTVAAGNAGPATQGSAYRIVGLGTFGHTSSATTLTFRIKFGGSTIITFTVNTPASALASRPFRFEIELFCLTSGVSGTWKMGGVLHARVGSTDTPFVESPASFTLNTTFMQNLDVTLQWGAANAANVASLDAIIIHRLTNV